MEKRYLLVYHNTFTDKIQNEYFEKMSDMYNFIQENIKDKKDIKILHKFRIQEI